MAFSGPPRARAARGVLTALPFLLFLHVAEANSQVSGEYNCEGHTLLFNEDSPKSDANCLQLLRTDEYQKRFDICKEKICYLFLQEPPFIRFDTKAFNDTFDALVELQNPFRCGSPEELHPSLGGIAFELHKRTVSRDERCVWAGPISSCTFNALVDFADVMAAKEYQFAITGLLLETPQRQCVHVPSAPFVDNSMIIIGRNTGDNPAAKGPFYQLVRPFRWSTWGIFGAVVMTFILVCFAIAIRFHVFRGRSLVTAFFIFAGERDQALAYENDLNNARSQFRPLRRRKSAKSAAAPSMPPPVPQPQMTDAELYAKNMSFATKYGLSMTLFRISLLAFVAVFALFYEVAVVNFLFQQQSLEISKSVKSLSLSELRQYSVLKNSALEQVWNASVNPRGVKFNGLDDATIPWQRCESARECVRWAADPKETASFDVTFDVVGKYLIKQESNCDELTIFETKDVLYQFNAGWLYNSKANADVRKHVDREIVGLRISGEIRDLIDVAIGDFSCTANVKADIGPLIILVPCIFFVFPPLLAAILALLCWRTKDEVEKGAGLSGTEAGNKSDVEGNDSKSSVPESTSGELESRAAKSGAAGEHFRGDQVSGDVSTSFEV